MEIGNGGLKNGQGSRRFLYSQGSKGGGVHAVDRHLSWGRHAVSQESSAEVHRVVGRKGAANYAWCSSLRSRDKQLEYFADWKKGGGAIRAHKGFTTIQEQSRGGD